jgi:hypothetical protein
LFVLGKVDLAHAAAPELLDEGTIEDPKFLKGRMTIGEDDYSICNLQN